MQGALTLLHCAFCGTISSSSPAASRRARQAKWIRWGKTGGLASSSCPETTTWSRQTTSECDFVYNGYVHRVLWQPPELFCVFEYCSVLQPSRCRHHSRWASPQAPALECRTKIYTQGHSRMPASAAQLSTAAARGASRKTSCTLSTPDRPSHAHQGALPTPGGVGCPPFGRGRPTARNLPKLTCLLLLLLLPPWLGAVR